LTQNYQEPQVQVHQPIAMRLRSGQIYQQPICYLQEEQFKLNDTVYKKDSFQNEQFIILKLLENKRVLICPKLATDEYQNEVIHLSSLTKQY